LALRLNGEFRMVNDGSRKSEGLKVNEASRGRDKEGLRKALRLNLE